MIDLVKKLRWFASADSELDRYEQHICWKAAKRIEELEAAADIDHANNPESWARLQQAQQRIKELETKLAVQLPELIFENDKLKGRIKELKTRKARKNYE